MLTNYTAMPRPLPTFLKGPTRLVLSAPTQTLASAQPQPTGGAGTLISNSPAGSDVWVNVKSLSLNVWNMLVNLTKSMVSSVQRAMAQP